MSQLLICHTQYNLILAVGISTSNDDLVLFKDFNLTDELKAKLESRFNRCLFLEGNYPKKEFSSQEKLDKITRDNGELRSFIGVYDRVFIVDDMCIQEMYALKCAYQNNKSVEMAWLEDGANAYFSNGVISGGMGATALKRVIRKCAFSLRFGLYSFYDLAPCMGGHKRLKTIFVTFPESVRPELQHKMKIAITGEQFIDGIKFMYSGKQQPFAPGSFLLAMDKLDVYGDKRDDVDRLVAKLVSSAKGNVYYKYHPRETEELAALKQCTELEKAVALESYLANSTTKDLTVIGIKSTALQTARKMGYKTISFIQRVEDAKEVVRFYESIGIICIDDPLRLLQNTDDAVDNSIR